MPLHAGNFWASPLSDADKKYPNAPVWMAQSASFSVDTAKQYAGFSSLTKFLELAESWKGTDTAFYEMIRDPARPVWVYFDADMKLTSGSSAREALAHDLQAGTHQVAAALLSVLQDFLPGDIILEPGVNCQVGQGSSSQEAQQQPNQLLVCLPACHLHCCSLPSAIQYKVDTLFLFCRWQVQPGRSKGLASHPRSHCSELSWLQLRSIHLQSISTIHNP